MCIRDSCIAGEENVTWPGKVKYFALSSGTSESASKQIPVTQDMIKAIKKMGFKQLYSMANFDVPSTAYQKGILMLGGTTTLFEKGEHYEGDMSGISAKNMPKWVSNLLYKPGNKISKRENWEDRIKPVSYTHLDVYKRQGQLLDIRKSRWYKNR